MRRVSRLAGFLGFATDDAMVALIGLTGSTRGKACKPRRGACTADRGAVVFVAQRALVGGGLRVAPGRLCSRAWPGWRGGGRLVGRTAVPRR
jgi:hypothetical protein